MLGLEPCGKEVDGGCQGLNFIKLSLVGGSKVSDFGAESGDILFQGGKTGCY